LAATDDSRLTERARPFEDRAAAASDPEKGTRVAVERAVDIVVSLGLLIVLAPLLLLVALAVRLDTSGPALFRQRRVGRHGREFTLLKFRSMVVDSAPDLHRRYIEQLALEGPGRFEGELRKLTADPRVTRFGGLLRRSSIDELPQLLNVLVGHMSLVGPRPAVAYELEHYELHHFERFRVRPGITGLWQVSGRGRLGLREMLDLDVEYARTHGLILDLKVLVKTPKAVLDAFTA
jgi:lipopolysaccharide/colanic/teichoic acid biosynthesis glycosyltransferase